MLSVDGLKLPELYFINQNYPLSPLQQPQPNVLTEYLDTFSKKNLDQNAMTSLLNSSSLPKWIKDLILSELRLLFLRTRNLNVSQKNQIVKDLIKIMFPNVNNQYLNLHAKDIWRSFYDWRNVLWTNLKNKYEDLTSSNNNITMEELNKLLENKDIHEIFKPWLRYAPNIIPPEVKQILRNVILFGFWCLLKVVTDPHYKFFMANTDLYTISSNFRSLSRYNIATSMDLSIYEVSALRSYSSVKYSRKTERELSKKRKANEKLLSSTKK